MKTIAFYLVFVGFISIPAAYEIFVLGEVDRKFRGSPWMALEVYFLGSVWIWFYVALAFFALSWLFGKLTKRDISGGLVFGTAFLTALICFLYTGNKAEAWGLSLQPDYVGIIALIFIFSILIFLKKKKQTS